MDFKNAKKYILERLEQELSSDLFYHGVHHTFDVYEVSIKIAELEGLNQQEKILVNTATLYHDAGFLFQYNNNEILAVELVNEVLPKFGYKNKEVAAISSMILSTQPNVCPNSLYDQIVCDADSDYLGRDDNVEIAASLHKELTAFNYLFSNKEWIDKQIDFLNHHKYFTQSAIILRDKRKRSYLKWLKSL